jgi:hypothetical protein
MIRRAAASLLLGVVLIGAGSSNPPETARRSMAISIVAVPCARDSSLPPEVRLTEVATLTKRAAEVRVDRKTISLPDGAYETRFRLPAGQYVVDVSSTNCAQPYSPLDLTVVDGHERHLFVQTVHDKVVMRVGLHGVAIMVPPGVTPILERVASNDTRRPVQDDGVFYFENLTEGQYVVMLPFGVNTVCEEIAVSPPDVVLNVGRPQIAAALKHADERNSGKCQAWIKKQGSV